MKNVQFMVVFAILMTSSHLLIGQEFEVPAAYDFKTKEDYAQYNPQIVAAVDWLEKTPVKTQAEKRQEVNRFVITWLTGTPAVTVELQKLVTDISEKNPDLLLAFMGGWARYQLQHLEETDKVKLNTEGIKTALRVYQLGGLKKDKQVEKLLKLEKAGELDAWVKTQIQ